MYRQCAWCLRLINRFGEPISTPQPKRYELSHGMCLACGAIWLERATSDTTECEARLLRHPCTEEMEQETT
jgi:hypothetical protein